jgi:hypothetical protein
LILNYTGLEKARDLVAMIRHSLPPLESDPERLPEYLPYHSAVSGGKVGGRKRRIIGVGHSIGGNALYVPNSSSSSIEVY